MSYCPRPAKVSKTKKGTPGKATINAPAQRTEACNAAASSSTTSGGTSTSTSTVTQGPIGPIGPQGPAGPAGADGANGTNGLNGLGFVYKGPFTLNVQYKKQDGQTNPLADVVTYMGQTWVAVEDNISSTEENPEFEPGNSTAWQLMAAKGVDGLNAQQKSILDSAADIWDWMKNASLKDWIEAAAVAAGIAIAGAVVVNMLVDDGTGDGDADQRFNGTLGYSGPYVKPSLALFIQSICEHAGEQCDVSLIDPALTIEIAIPSGPSCRELLEKISLAYQLDMVSSAGILKFVPKKTVADKSIVLDDMGFTTEGSSIPAPYTAKRFQGIDLPQKVTLTYYAEDFDYNAFSQAYELFGYENGQHVQVSLPITLEHAQALKICETALINAHLERMNYKFTTTYKHADVEPSDVLDSPMGLIRVSRVDERGDGLLEFECYDAGTEESYDASGADVQVPTPSTNEAIELGYSQALFFDPNCMNDSDTYVRVLAAVHGYGKKGWPGAIVYESKDGGATYQEVIRTTQESTVGLVEVPITDAPYYVWDTTSTITVKLKTGKLSSKSDLAVLNGENWCLIGQEIIGFANATLVAEKTYELSRLIRGRQGTEIFTGTHQANELFVLLDDAPVQLIFEKNSDRFTNRKYKIVTIGSSLGVTTAQTIGVYSNNLRPWAVYNASVTHLPNSDWKISWKGRARFDSKLKDFVTSGNDSTFGGYGIAVLDSSNNVIKSYVTTSTEFSITNAMQTADFGGLLSSIKVSIVPLDKTFGGGYPTIINS